MNKEVIKRRLEGVVVSNKMDKTIVVEVVNFKTHSKYKKQYKVNKKHKAHDEKNECGLGDVVRVSESKPFSKTKNWALIEVIEKSVSID